MEDAPESHRPPKDMRAECIEETAKALVKLLSIGRMRGALMVFPAELFENATQVQHRIFAQPELGGIR